MEVDMDAQVDGGMDTSQKKKEDKTKENKKKHAMVWPRDGVQWVALVEWRKEEEHNKLMRWFDHVMVPRVSFLYKKKWNNNKTRIKYEMVWSRDGIVYKKKKTNQY